PGLAWAALRLRWTDAEVVPGTVDLGRWDAAVFGLSRAGRPLVVVIEAGHPQYGTYGPDGFLPAAGADPGTALENYRRGWNRLLREAARRWSGKVAAFAIDGALPGAAASEAAQIAAYEIKSAAVTLTAEAPSSGVWIRARDAAEGDLVVATFEGSTDLVPYVDGLLFATAPGEDLAARAAAERRRWLELEAAATLAFEVTLPADLPSAARDDAALTRAAELLGGGADLALIAIPGPTEPGAAPSGARSLAAFAALVGPSYGLAPREGRGIAWELPPAGVAWSYYFDEERFREVVVYWAAPDAAEPAPAQATVRVDRTLRREITLFDPLGRIATPPQLATQPDGTVLVTVPLAPRPLLLAIQREKTSPGGVGLDTTETEARSRRTVTAEEIIAAHQRLRAFEDDRLRNVRRPGLISFRARVGAATGSIELSVKADQFWEPATGAEWVILDTFFNGVKLNWNKFPELPFVSREKVVAAPLDLNLDRRYEYVYEGVDEVEGRPAWRLRFEPLAETVSLYRGTAWIDQRTAALLKVRLRFTKTEPPVISEEETQFYAPFEAPDGTALWLPVRLEGQQIYTIAGANVVVLREIDFGPPTINDPGFAAARAQVYASDRQMLRDTDTGFKWLSKNEEGERAVLEKGDPTQWFAVAGALRDESTQGVVPLAGVNYVDVDFRGKKEIFNAFIGGAFNNIAWTAPSFLGTRLDAGVNATLVAFEQIDRVYADGEEIPAQAVASIPQALRFTFGYPLGDFVKLRSTLGLDYIEVRDAEDTKDFVLPPDHLVYQASLGLGFDRGGWSLGLRGAYAHRSSWAPWGPEGALATAEEVDATTSFLTWEAAVQRSFFLPYFQQIELAATWYDGVDLDRFSDYEFGLFGTNRLPGFGGSGIRFGRGGVFELTYGFNIAQVVGLDLNVEYALVDDPQVAPGFSGHTGIGLAGSLAGPWETLWRLDVGYSVASELEPAEGKFDFFLAVLKLF
ncbi:MAG: hypothetical protein MUC67_07140, partial [Acidobacteria bacterium]|nr:hypothetical protein [Acidobacteriota bacterium]